VGVQGPQSAAEVSCSSGKLPSPATSRISTERSPVAESAHRWTGLGLSTPRTCRGRRPGWSRRRRGDRVLGRRGGPASAAPLEGEAETSDGGERACRRGASGRRRAIASTPEAPPREPAAVRGIEILRLPVGSAAPSGRSLYLSLSSRRDRQPLIQRSFLSGQVDLIVRAGPRRLVRNRGLPSFAMFVNERLDHVRVVADRPMAPWTWSRSCVHRCARRGMRTRFLLRSPSRRE